MQRRAFSFQRHKISTAKNYFDEPIGRRLLAADLDGFRHPVHLDQFQFAAEIVDFFDNRGGLLTQIAVWTGDSTCTFRTSIPS